MSLKTDGLAKISVRAIGDVAEDVVFSGGIAAVCLSEGSLSGGLVDAATNNSQLFVQLRKTNALMSNDTRTETPDIAQLIKEKVCFDARVIGCLPRSA